MLLEGRVAAGPEAAQRRANADGDRPPRELCGRYPASENTVATEFFVSAEEFFRRMCLSPAAAKIEFAPQPLK